MTSTATLVTLRHGLFGEATGALSESGAWIALIPGKKSRDEVVARCETAGLTTREGEPAEQDAAAEAFARWFATGECPKLAPLGTEFQLRVWERLAAIPRGVTRTYGEIARELGESAPRAVGRAVGANRVGFFIPCHRVVATYGEGGFAWGPVMKEKLLANEGVSLASLRKPSEDAPGRPARHFPKPEKSAKPAKGARHGFEGKKGK